MYLTAKPKQFVAARIFTDSEREVSRIAEAYFD